MTIAQQLRQEGMQRGMQQGMVREKHIIARRLLEKGALEGLVAETTELSLDEIEKIKEELN